MSKNIKEIGKELLGKSLNSFHRKTGLTQLEKNNEMQDGILDGILSQVDDAYIEKTEQSNVIHLDGSGDGVVVLDSIEGNTMVNLFNKYNYKGVLPNLYYNMGTSQLEVKNGLTYTCITNSNVSYHLKYHTGNEMCLVFNQGYNIGKFTAKKDSKMMMIATESSGDYNVDILLLEGDWTNKEIPASYFEGLQSSFEEKVNEQGKYEIEILSQSKNIFNANSVNSNHIVQANGNLSSNSAWVLYDYEPIAPLQNIVISEKYVNGRYFQYKMCYYDKDKNFISAKDLTGYDGYKTDITPSNAKYFRLNHSISVNGNSVNREEIMVSYGTTYRKKYVPYKHNKIKLLLDEPLRSISTMKDKLCIKDGKLKVERNLGQVTFSGNEDWQDNWQYSNETDFLTRYYTLSYNEFGKYAKHPRRNVVTKCLSDSFSEVNCFSSVWGKQYNYIAIHGDNNPYYFQVSILKSMVGNDLTKQGFKNWIKNNGLSVVYPLAEPYYEEVLNEYGEPILLEGYENGTIYIDSTIVPTTTVRYTPKMESFKTLKEVENNNIMLTNDVNDNIIPYMMDVDLMIMEKEMALMSHKNIRKMEVLDMTSMQKRTQDMLERLIKGKTLTEQECKTRVTTYLNAGKITDEQAKELNFLIDEIYA